MHALAILVPAAAVDSTSDLLSEELGALSVSVQDADAGSAAEQPVFDEPGQGSTGAWQRALLSALFADEAAAMKAATWVAATQGTSGASILELAAVADDDWVRRSQAQFGPTEIAAGFWIVPSWCEVPAAARMSIHLDPGRAFGTGTHPTTRMCLRWLAADGAAAARSWHRVLDYGTGSGVLAIAAALLGAVEIDALDLDPDAVETARINAQANGVVLRTGLPDIARAPYGLIVANILATPLKLLAPLLSALLDSGGTLVLSGILERQADELAAAYAPWLDLGIAEAQDGWILMTGTRTSGYSTA